MQVEVIKDYFTDLQQRIVAGLEQLDGGKVAFLRDSWQRAEGGGGLSCVIENGALFERGGVNFSHVQGPPYHHRQPLCGQSWQAATLKPWGCRWSYTHAIPMCQRYI